MRLYIDGCWLFSAGTDEYTELHKALTCSRDILSYVNEAVKEFENQQRLRDIQKRLDKKSFENSNLPIVSEFKVCPARFSSTIVMVKSY